MNEVKEFRFAAMSVEIQPSAYVLSVLHALKTPANGVVGLLIGTHGPNSIKVGEVYLAELPSFYDHGQDEAKSWKY